MSALEAEKKGAVDREGKPAQGDPLAAAARASIIEATREKAAIPAAATTGIEREGKLAQTDKPVDEITEPEATVVEPEPPSLRRELGALFGEMLRGRGKWAVLNLVGAIVVVLVANMVGQVRLNEWNGSFFDAVERRDLQNFFREIGVFAAIIAVLLTLVVAQTWLQERLKIRLRERLTHVLLDVWLAPRKAYQLGMAASDAQPDQRLQEDARLFSEFTTELGVGMLNSLLLLVSFISVLWVLSTAATFVLFGYEVTIPGYMVWIALGYALVGSGLTLLVGQPMIRLNTERYAKEAELRFALVRVNESSESVALYGGEADERRNLTTYIDAVLVATRKLSGALARLTWITSGYGWLAIVVPIVAAAPGYFAGTMTFGAMMMVVGAFNQVQAALRYFVENFPKIADWRSAVLRVATFRETAENLERCLEANPRITIEPHPEGWLAFEHVSIALADGSVIIDEATAEIQPGERVLITGASGSGKSTLFRAISGLWPWGSGRVLAPPADAQMFLPQRPYLPLGTLRAALSYPKAPDAFLDEAVRAALARCGLGAFADRLDDDERWDRSLSLGQQQRVAFARLLLHKPKWIFLDEATSALDDDTEAAMLAILDEELAGASVLSIGHKASLEAFHTRKIHMRKTGEGAVLIAPPPRRVKCDPTRARRFRLRPTRQS